MIIVVIAGIVMAMAAGAGVARGLWSFTQANTGSVRVLGNSMKIYTNAAATTQLLPTDVLAFGDVRIGGGPTAVKNYWIKNESQIDAAYPTIKLTAALATGLALSDSTWGVITTTPKPLWTPPVINWVPMANPTTLVNAIDAASTTVTLAAAITPTGVYYAQIDSEFISWSSPGSTLTIVRGCFGTVPTSHAAGALFTVASGVPTITTPAVLLAAGATLPLNLSISAVTGAVGNITPQNFIVEIAATTGY